MQLVRASTLDAWADHVTARLVARLHERPDLRVCLPTGLTPAPVYERIVSAVGRGAVSFARAEVFLLDEFGGTVADEAGRCDQMLLRGLIAHIDLPPARFHRFDLSGDVDAECRRYETAIGAGCDLALLGIGTNGHVGMNEPGSAADSLTRRVDLAASTVAASARYFGRSTGLPTWGVTLGLGTLLRSREIWILATGRGKSAIVRDTLEAPVSPAIPSTLLRHHPSITLFGDDEACSLLP